MRFRANVNDVARVSGSRKAESFCTVSHVLARKFEIVPFPLRQRANMSSTIVWQTGFSSAMGCSGFGARSFDVDFLLFLDPLF